MQRIKSLFVRGKDVEIPEDVETMTHEEPRESMARRLFVKGREPIFVTPYEDVTTRVGMKVPALKLYSADPYCTMEARRECGGVPIQLPPGVPFPIVWSPSEQWRPPVMDESEKHINFHVPLGRTFAVHGMMKRIETEAWATVPIVQAPYLWSKINIIGRHQFTLDVISADFDTRTQLVTKQLEIERLLRSMGEAALTELQESAQHMPGGQKTFAYDEMLRGLRLGGVDELLKSKDPEAALTRKIEELIKRRDEFRRSKR